MVLGDLIIEETDVFFIIMIIKKIFSVILHLSNNTKYLRPKIAESDAFWLSFFLITNLVVLSLVLMPSLLNKRYY